MPFGSVTLNDGNKAPVIAFGTGSKYKGQDVSEYIIQAVEQGFSHVDTAEYYANEESVGEALQVLDIPRNELFITTKYSGTKGVREAFEQSVSKIGVKKLDMYLIHMPTYIKDLEGCWKQFEELKKDGLTKSIGVSNFNVQQLEQIVKSATIKPAVNQIFFNPYNYHENKPLLEYAAKHGIQIEAYSSLTPITRYPGGPVDAPIAAAAKRIGGTPAQVIFLWVRSKGVTIVTTTTNKGRMQEYLDAGNLASLTQEEIAAIDAAAAAGPPTPTWVIVSRLVMFLLGVLLVFRVWHCV